MNISRRDLVKFGSLGAVAAASVGVLSGCTSASGSTKQDEIINTMGGTITDDVRATSVDDPIYMGSNTNFAGQTLTIGVGRNGQIANQAMIDKRDEFDPQLVKITDNIYQAIGNGMSTSTMIIGDTGIIIVDSGEVNEEMQLCMDMFRTVTDKPVAAVLFSHDHYVGGTEAIVGKGNPKNIPLVANEVFSEGGNIQLVDTYTTRSMIQFGSLLPTEGEDASVSGGLGPFMSNPNLASHTQGFIAPNTFVSSKQKMTEYTFGGIKVECYPMVSDTITNVNFWFPDEKVAVTNQVWPTFFNMYTLRGALYRDPRGLMTSVDTIISWEPVAHCSAHGLPILGGVDAVKKELTLYRDCMQLVYDQTCRFMNEGYGPDEIAEKIHFPAYMLEGFCTKPLYGEIPHYVRAVYSGNVGWFGVDALELHPVSKSFEGAKIVDLMGGVDNVILAAQEAMLDNQYAWAATLATYVLKGVDAENLAAKAVKAQAFRKMAQVTYATNTRHYYSTQALVLEGKLTVPTGIPQDPSRVSSMPRNFWLEQLRVSLIPEKAEGMDTFLTTTFTDEKVTKSMDIRNCVGVLVDGAVEGKQGIELRMPFEVMGGLLSGTAGFDALVADGTIEVVGSKEDLAAIRGIFNRPFSFV